MSAAAPRRLMGATATLLLVIVAALSGPAALAQTCTRAEFEAVVDEASSTLTSINNRNAPVFQARLRQLKEKRGWSNEQLIREGEPFVRDETIQGYDQAAMQLMTKINSADSGVADCAALAGLRQSLADLVETQTAKWAYMFAKIDKALAE